jgi:hypothetical protein
MDTRDLDRLVGKTEMTPTSKRALRHVRESVMRGRVADPVLGNGCWEVAVNGARLRFSFRKDKDGSRTK